MTRFFLNYTLLKGDTAWALTPKPEQAGYEIVPYTVVSVGRKYITAKRNQISFPDKFKPLLPIEPGYQVRLIDTKFNHKDHPGIRPIWLFPTRRLAEMYLEAGIY